MNSLAGGETQLANINVFFCSLLLTREKDFLMKQGLSKGVRV